MTEMSATWRDHLRLRAEDPVLTVHNDRDVTPAADPSWDEALRRQQLDAMTEYDPNATLVEELRLRLIGPDATGASLKATWFAIVSRFESAVSAFASKPLDLKVTGYSAGSTVVHLVADEPDIDDLNAADIGPLHHTPLAQAAQQLMEALVAAENSSDLSRWRRELEEVEKFSDELQEHALEAGVRYLSSGGRVRDASLTATGMSYLASLRETRDEDEEKLINGRVTELRQSGAVKVKAAPHRTATAWEVRVDPDALLDMGLTLGKQVSWWVQQNTTKDRLGREGEKSYTYLRESDEVPLPFED